MSPLLDRIFGKTSPIPSNTKAKKRRNGSECTKVGYRICRTKNNKDCRWVYGSIKGQPTKVKKRHCRTRKNQPRL